MKFQIFQTEQGFDCKNRPCEKAYRDGIHDPYWVIDINSLEELMSMFEKLEKDTKVPFWRNELVIGCHDIDNDTPRFAVYRNLQRL